MKKKILFLIESFAGGGVEKVFIDLINNMDISKYDITVMSIWDYGVRKKDLRKDVKYKSIFPNIKGISRVFHNFVEKSDGKLLYKLGIREKYDIEIAFIEGRATKIIGASTNPNSRKIAWVHIDLSQGHWTSRVFKENTELEKSYYKKFNDLVFVSNSAKEGFIKIFGDNFPKMHVKYNPIIAPDVIRKSKEEISDIVKPTDKKLLVTSGRLVSQKGFDNLLEACNKLNKDGVKYELWILGEGWGRSSLEELIEKYNLYNIKLLGYKDNPHKYIKEGNLFVCSSRNEGFSLVIAEAMILGLPVISTNCSGPNELLNFGEYGFMVENTEDALYEGLKEILMGEEKLRYYIEKSKERINFFNYKDRISDIERLFSNDY
ncbi:glycosyltransferase [uncultured Clostridium sp.]|jgi:glycosyltransferase involved in cell wall biosynthesis|uniref:glycosyltransferase n=1 Tax=uncultured Clostridium sp. TaxID=59620 RepID=UPI0025F38E6F|nr:glycosyltransferase [uncultured Clostridium sp.]